MESGMLYFLYFSSLECFSYPYLVLYGLSNFVDSRDFMKSGKERQSEIDLVFSFEVVYFSALFSIFRSYEFVSLLINGTLCRL
jgi:hypothetical protein